MLVSEHQNEKADRVGPYVLKGVGHSALRTFSTAPSGGRKSLSARDTAVRNAYRGAAAASTNFFAYAKKFNSYARDTKTALAKAKAGFVAGAVGIYPFATSAFPSRKRQGTVLCLREQNENFLIPFLQINFKKQNVSEAFNRTPLFFCIY